MMLIMNIETAISTYGLTEFANMLGESAQAVNNWRRRGVPAERCPSIERATGGKVRCEDLRPDVDWSVLRGNCKEAA
jgi:DNA-binding transcriptional regulator YdaS (Cro superfamily)